MDLSKELLDLVHFGSQNPENKRNVIDICVRVIQVLNAQGSSGEQLSEEELKKFADSAPFL